MAGKRVPDSPTRAEGGRQLVLSFPAAKKSRSFRKASGSERQTRELGVVGLFAGVGGSPERGLHRSGHKTRLLCELDEAAASVLRSRFPGIPITPDVRDVVRLPNGTDLLVAGFPCQDLSQAGRTAGISGDRSGLWIRCSDLVRDMGVAALAAAGERAVHAPARQGRGDALPDAPLADELGFRWAYRVVDARAFGLPQRRQRVLSACVLVHADPRDVLLSEDAGSPPEDPLGGGRLRLLLDRGSAGWAGR